MSKHDLKRRPSPLSGPGGRGIDPDVQKTIQHAQQRWRGNETEKITIRKVPSSLASALRGEGARLTGHKRRGFSDLVVALLEYAWVAYQDGEVEIELQPTAVEHRIKLVRE
jgi:hypothetical protein